MDKPGLMVALAIGDAYGAGFEFAPPEMVAKTNTVQGYRPHPKGGIKPGRYTDDTQLSCGVAEFMLSDDPWTTVYLARRLLIAFKRDPRPGYASGFYNVLLECQNGTELVQKLTPQSDRSGGAMRAGPCGLYPTVWEAMNLAVWQASITHATVDGMNAAAAAAALVFACREGHDQKDLPHYLNDVVPGYSWATPWEGPVSNRGIPVLRAVVTALAGHKTMKGILKASVAFTGDTDTVAALAMGAAAMHPDIPCDLPDVLWDKLENGPYGRDYLRKLDAQLLQSFHVVPPVPEEDPPDEEGLFYA